MRLQPQFKPAIRHRRAENVFFQLQPESGQIRDHDLSLFDAIGRGIDAGRCRLVPLHKREAVYGSRQVPGDVVAQMTAVVVRRGANIPAIELRAPSAANC